MEVEPYYEADLVTLYLGDCRDVMRAFPDASVDAIVTDPPYELGFMGRKWDASGIAYDGAVWSEALRVLKPGGHLLAFGGTRTYHRMAVAIEDAGFEVRDCLAWMYGSGFPKSLDVSKAIDRANGDERPVVAEWNAPGRGTRADVQAYGLTNDHGTITSAASAAWEGWGTALKPAYEPIVLARKPLVGTVAANVLRYGTGALNVDGCRIETSERWSARSTQDNGGVAWGGSLNEQSSASHEGGRWPANVLMDEEAAAILDATVGESVDGVAVQRNGGGQRIWGTGEGLTREDAGYGGRGGPSRFFYTAKAARSEREAGVEVEPARRSDGRESDIENPRLRTNQPRNDHPTVKPVDVMRWLCRLVTPPGGVVLDPFNGSGTTGMAALDEGFRYIGIEQEPRYIEIARQRITHRHVIETAQVEPNAELVQGRML